MGKQNPILQGLAVAVILLVMGVAFAPSTNAGGDPGPDLDCDGAGISRISNHISK